MKLEYTERGFGLVEFVDDYEEKCSLQESSNKDFSWRCPPIPKN